MSQGVQPVDAATLRKWLENDEVILIDVREAQEYERVHIPGSLLLPLSRIHAEPLPESRGKRIVVCCASGARSFMAGDRMLAEHYGGVYNLDGGLTAWQLAGHAVKGDGMAVSGPLSRSFNMFRNTR